MHDWANHPENYPQGTLGIEGVVDQTMYDQSNPEALDWFEVRVINETTGQAVEVEVTVSSPSTPHLKVDDKVIVWGEPGFFSSDHNPKIYSHDVGLE